MGWFTARRGRTKGDGTSDATPSANGTAPADSAASTAQTSSAENAATERRLIRAIVRHGSRTAADQLVRMHFDDVLAFVWRVTGDREHALDLTQETMIAALRSLAGYDPDKASLRTWLYAIASHKVIDARRANRVTVTPLPMDETLDGTGTVRKTRIDGNPSGAATVAGGGPNRTRDPADIQADADLLARIDAFVGRFDAGTQEIFHLHTAAGLPFPQIAAARGERTEAVKARYYRLIQAIRKEFADERTN
ncbi:sigma-70 family RNA polymerase sigma factor [Bifidobacterium reuteri]|uniref:RNA polymerase sigma factor n=1 Tax=Bifidobacterium reuteri TaxID=983706 RepID=A0A5J5E945_9BIFI|nr:sigma-70 family RNA polymerase sigma factor [Bifidobacterium reuteri]KAA8825540.1 sigma-70 family RNA polymerase sigma factor [Bifidobacterium reuteri]